jgi:hypothetical protein
MGVRCPPVESRCAAITFGETLCFHHLALAFMEENDRLTCQSTWDATAFCSARLPRRRHRAKPYNRGPPGGRRPASARYAGQRGISTGRGLAISLARPLCGQFRDRDALTRTHCSSCAAPAWGRPHQQTAPAGRTGWPHRLAAPAFCLPDTESAIRNPLSFPPSPCSKDALWRLTLASRDRQAASESVATVDGTKVRWFIRPIGPHVAICTST